MAQVVLAQNLERERRELVIPQHRICCLNLVARGLRLGVYKIAALAQHFFRCFESFLLNRHQNELSGLKYCDRRQDYNIDRARATTAKLRQLGGESLFVKTVDREAIIHVLDMSATRLRERVESLGGAWTFARGGLYITLPATARETQADFCEALDSVYPCETVSGNLRYKTSGDITVSEGFNPGQKTVFMAKLAKPLAMAKSKAAFFLGLGCNVVSYDVRGMIDSRGYASEAGVYLDARAAFDVLRDRYVVENTVLFSNCGESFVSTQILKENPSVSALMLTPSTSLTDVVARTGRVSAWALRKCGRHLQAQPLSSSRDFVDEDLFDNIGKLRSIESGTGRLAILSTQGDELVIDQDARDICEVATEKGFTARVFENDPGRCQLPEAFRNFVHMANPFHNPGLMQQVYDFVLA